MRRHRHLSRLRTLAVAGTVATVAGFCAGDAQAATVSVSGGSLAYSAAAGEVNHVTVAPWGFYVRVSDTGVVADGGAPVRLTSGVGCWPLSTSSVVCAATSIGAGMGDGDDSFDSSGVALPAAVSGDGGDDLLTTGAGADAVDGGDGADTVAAGGGDDVVTVRDGAVDSVACGDGLDGVTADAGDLAAVDCEGVDRPAVTPPGGDGGGTTTGGGNTATGGNGNGTGGGDSTPGNPGGGPSTGDTGQPDDKHPGNDHTPPANGNDGNQTGHDAAATNALPPVIPAQTVSVGTSGVAVVQVACPEGSGGCRGTVVLDLPSATANSAKATATAVAARRRPNRKPQPTTRLGKAKFTAKEGTTARVRVRLSRRGRQRIARHPRTRARIVVTTRSADGNAVTTTQDVTLERRRPPRPRGRRH